MHCYCQQVHVTLCVRFHGNVLASQYIFLYGETGRGYTPRLVVVICDNGDT